MASNRARSVVTCDSWIGSEEILVPQCLAYRLTYPVVVQAHNKAMLQDRMQRGAVPFLQRHGQNAHMRSISHIAIQNLVMSASDRIVRRGNKFPVTSPPMPRPEDIPFPVQPTWSQLSVSGSPMPILCFGDRIVRHGSHTGSIDPLDCVVWPVLQIGDTLLMTPQDGDYVLMNRQPTLVQESILGIRIGHFFPVQV